MVTSNGGRISGFAVDKDPVIEPTVIDAEAETSDAGPVIPNGNNNVVYKHFHDWRGTAAQKTYIQPQRREAGDMDTHAPE